ncbi:phosphatidate cytidylyltransferase [Dongia sp.]|uniref:phosphatidate cytidylyltransferase n=1 Tax=Dongia sp. TaxID=1977262 RepID=UPI0035B43FEE
MIFDMTINVAYALAAIFVLLLVATAVAWPQRKKKHELWLRTRTWWVIIALLGLSIALPSWVPIALFGLISFLAFKEFVTLIPTRRADHRVLLWAYLSIPLQYYWVSIGWYGMFIIFIPVYIFLALPLRMVLAGETQGFIKAAGTVHWGLMIAVFSLSHAAFLLALPAANNPVAGGDGLLLYLLLLTEINDVGQYCSGKLLGKHKVVPKVSPNKTVEGLVGGVVITTVIAALAAPFLTPLAWYEAGGIGFVLALAGFAGDVTISAVKRDLKLKDSGSLLPGHGGILDRVDSLTFTAPLFFHIVYFLYY